ncbi:MAG: hypothetical protein V4613_14090 [Bacteroidota bacterium]
MANNRIACSFYLIENCKKWKLSEFAITASVCFASAYTFAATAGGGTN